MGADGVWGGECAARKKSGPARGLAVVDVGYESWGHEPVLIPESPREWMVGPDPEKPPENLCAQRRTTKGSLHQIRRLAVLSESGRYTFDSTRLYWRRQLNAIKQSSIRPSFWTSFLLTLGLAESRTTGLAGRLRGPLESASSNATAPG